jgi:hypothetical protein
MGTGYERNEDIETADKAHVPFDVGAASCVDLYEAVSGPLAAPFSSLELLINEALVVGVVGWAVRAVSAALLSRLLHSPQPACVLT